MCVCVTFISWRDMHLYLRAGWMNWSQYFGKWQIWSLTTHWNHFGLLISNPGVSDVLQSQEGVPDKKKMYHISQCFKGFGWFFSSFLGGLLLKKLLAKFLNFKFFVVEFYNFWVARNGAKTQIRGRSLKIGAKPLLQDRRMQGLEWSAHSALKF